MLKTERQVQQGGKQLQRELAPKVNVKVCEHSKPTNIKAFAYELGLISLHLHKVSTKKDDKLSVMLNNHANVFDGLGK